MDIEKIYTYCLNKKGTSDDFPFDQDTLVFKVGDKMFCLTSLKRWETGDYSINLKCDPDYAEDLRERYEAVEPGYHMSKKHWNTVHLNKDLPYNDVLKLIDQSYDLVVKNFSKKERKNFKNL